MLQQMHLHLDSEDNIISIYAYASSSSKKTMFFAAREHLQITGLGTKFVLKKINIKSSLVTRLFV